MVTNMDIWEILGIPPTTDIAAIKQAYAAKAKEWHPEEHPEEFKRLRSAYRAAVSYAKNGEEQLFWSGAAVYTASAGEMDKEPEEQKKTVRPEKKEPGGNTEHEEKEEAEFSYDDVSAFYQKELAEKFFRDFRWIAWNPYLQNTKAFWSNLLLQVNYEDLYYHEGFRQKLLREICRVQGWRRETLEYIEWWLNLYRETDRDEIHGTDAGGTGKTSAGKRRSDGWRETESKRWKWKKRWSSLPHLSMENAVSKEQRFLHYEILSTMRERGFDASLLTAASAETYMEYYRAFVDDEDKWLTEQRKKDDRRRRGDWTAIWVVACLMTVILVWELAVKPARRAEEEAALRAQQAEEAEVLRREQEQQEQEEWQRELEERFQTMQEQYEDWMEQE